MDRSTVNHDHLYNSTWPILIQWIRVMIVKRSSIYKENVLPVCEKTYHTNKDKDRKGRRLQFCGTVHYNVVKHF